MKWAHLPLSGRIYDQHPELLDQWRYIFEKRAEYESEQQKKRDAEMNKRQAKTRSVSRPSRRR